VSLGVLGAATIWLDGSQTSIFLGPLQLVSVAGIALVAVTARSSALLVCHPAARAVGRWSYGIYLVHWPLVLVMPDDASTFTRVVAVSILSVALAAASHRLVEAPIRTNGLMGWRLVAAPVAALASLVAALVLAVPVVPPAMAERSKDALDWNTLEAAPPPSAPVAIVPAPAMGAIMPTPTPSSTVPDPLVEPEAADPRIGTPGSTTTLVAHPAPEVVLVIGDSTASVLAHGLTATGRFQVIDGGVWGCPIVTTEAVRPTQDSDRSTDYCPDLERQVNAVDMLDPDLVVLMASPPEQWDQRYPSVDGWHGPGDLHWRQAHDDHLARFLEVHPTLPVVVVDAPPARAPSSDALENPERLAAWNAQIERWDVGHPQVGVLPYSRHLADPDSEIDRAQRPDGVHLTDPVIEELVADHLADDLVALTRSLLADIDAAGGR
jgi:hypothetical protein